MMKILVVDDNADCAESLALLLRMYGHDTHVAYSGLQALVTNQSFRPELLISDIRMPGMDGLELAQEIRRQPCPPVLAALTAESLDEQRDAALEAGFDHFLVKPVDVRKLNSLIDAVQAWPSAATDGGQT